MSGSYEGFASMYDNLMAGTPYNTWAAYIDEVFEFSGKQKPIILDLACGTGSITLLLAEMGYDMIGVDASADMLAEAQRKAHEQKINVLFLAQDARELDLFGTIDGAVSVCDGLNYILREDELQEVFRRVQLFINPGGIFIFDMNTEYKFKEILADRVFEYEAPGGEAYVWENNYDAETMINEYKMFFYTFKDDSAFRELHRQRAYRTGDVCNMLAKAGFAEVKTYDDYSKNPPNAESTRVVFVARKGDDV